MRYPNTIATSERVNCLLVLITQYSRNKKLSKKRNGTTKLKTDNAETIWDGIKDMIPVIINKSATNILIANTTLFHIEVGFFTV